MKSKLVFTIGNSLMGDDAAGPLLADMIRQAPLPDWEVLDGGFAPENYLHKIREMAPCQVLLVDSAEMGVLPGEIYTIQEKTIEDPFFMTTHSLPLSYLIRTLQEITPQVELVGIQPEVIAFGYPVSARVKQAVKQVYTCLKRNELTWEILKADERNGK